MSKREQPKAEIGELQALARSLKAAQQELIDAAARAGALPALGTVRRVSKPESAIAAAILLIEERGGPDER
jgi:hypothetical protein